MEKNEKSYLQSYESVSDDLKYLTQSLVRLKILAVLFDSPENMKGITQKTGLSYSSISGNMHKLELKNFLYRDSNRYFLTNAAKLQLNFLLKFNDVINLLNNLFTFLDKHLIDMIPINSQEELYMLKQSGLIEADDVDVYRIYNFIESSLATADEARCILPFYHDGFNEKLNELVKKGKYVEAIVSKELFKTFMKKSEIAKVLTFSNENNFLLILTDYVMILGLFRQDGFFDQNRILTSENPDALKWGLNLFENFKKLNK